MEKIKSLKVLIGCEASGVIREEFIKLGHDAWSCDLKPSEIPSHYHLQMDLLELLADKTEQWDLGIFHPECKYLCFSGEQWIKGEKEYLRNEAFEFFKKCYDAPIAKVCVENSHSVFLKKNFRKPTQNIHPYHFGDPFKKMTCLWLRGLAPLMPTNILPIGHRYPQAWLEQPGPDRSARRAKTYPGIARAMARQWGGQYVFNLNDTLE